MVFFLIRTVILALRGYLEDYLLLHLKYRFSLKEALKIILVFYLNSDWFIILPMLTCQFLLFQFAAPVLAQNQCLSVTEFWHMKRIVDLE